MKLTKYAHACFTVEKNNQILVVDPGNLSPDFHAPSSVTAIVITHEHADHFDSSILEEIINTNPDAVVIAHPSLTEKMELLPTVSVLPGEKYNVGPFNLSFFGGEHALIHESLPIIPNLGVLINDTVYYPGDSLVAPGTRPVEVLALPVAAPWLKVSETLDFLRAVKPRIAFATHDAILSSDGQQVVDRMVQAIATAQDTHYLRIDEPLTINEKDLLT